jgi:hypothetical protein
MAGQDRGAAMSRRRLLANLCGACWWRAVLRYLIMKTLMWYHHA